MAVHATTGQGNVTVEARGGMLLVFWGAGATFTARAVNSYSGVDIEVAGSSTTLDWGPPERGRRLTFVLATTALAIAMALDLARTLATAQRANDPAGGAIT